MSSAAADVVTAFTQVAGGGGLVAFQAVVSTGVAQAGTLAAVFGPDFRACLIALDGKGGATYGQPNPANLSEGGNGNGGLGGTQVALGQTQAGATQPTQTATQASTYQARVPVELWAELDPEKRAEAMAQFWSQF